MTLIPTPEHFARFKNFANRFRYGGKDNDFSGLVLYHTLDGALVAFGKQAGGRHTSYHFAPDMLRNGTEADVADAMQRETRDVYAIDSRVMMYVIGENPDDLWTDTVTVIGPKPKICPVCKRLEAQCICLDELPPTPPAPGTPDPNPGESGSGGSSGAGDSNTPPSTPAGALTARFNLTNPDGKPTLSSDQTNLIIKALEKIMPTKIWQALEAKLRAKDIKITIRINPSIGDIDAQYLTNHVIEFKDIAVSNKVQALFFHELVHAYQHQTYPSMSPLSAVEFEAYTLQNAFMRNLNDRSSVSIPSYITDYAMRTLYEAGLDLLIPLGGYPTIEGTQNLYNQCGGGNPSSPFPFGGIGIMGPT